MRFRGALVILCALVATAVADTPQQQADKLFAEGRELLTVQKDSKAACEKFEAAIKLDATATGTMLNLGLCYENLGRYATSIKWFRKAQAAASENKLTEYEDAAKTHTGQISRKVPVLKLDVKSAETEVRIDGERIDATTYGRVEVDPGSHEIVGRAAGKKSVVQTVEVTEAQAVVVTIEVSEDAVPVFVDRGASRRRLAYAAVGVGLATVAVSAFTANHFQNKHNDPLTPEDEAETAGNHVKVTSTIIFVGGCAAIASGVILYLTAPGKEQVSDGTAFAPVITDDQLGFAVSGSF